MFAKTQTWAQLIQILDLLSRCPAKLWGLSFFLLVACTRLHLEKKSLTQSGFRGYLSPQ